MSEVLTPEWVKDAVFHQILADTFACPDRVPKPQNLQPWEALPSFRGYKGGDLLGKVKEMKRETKIIIALSVVLLVACAAIACLVGLVVGAGWFELTSRRQSLIPVEPQVAPQPRVVPPRLSVAALVTEVVEGGPAAQAGIEIGDLILTVDGEQIQRDAGLSQLLATFQPGDRVELTVHSQGRTREVQVRLGRHPDDSSRPYLGITYRLIPNVSD